MQCHKPHEHTSWLMCNLQNMCSRSPPIATEGESVSEILHHDLITGYEEECIG